MRKLNLTKAALWCTAISPLILTACVDDSYDLSKDIDMTITVGGNLGIPGGGTEEFTLEDIMDLDDPDNSILQADPVTGEYSLLKSSSEETSVHIDAVVISGTSDRSHQVLNFNTPIGGTLTSEVNDLQVHFDFEDYNVTDDIVELSDAEVSCRANMFLEYTEAIGNVGALTLHEGFKIEIAVNGQREQGVANTLVMEIADEAKDRFAMVESPGLGRQVIRFLQDVTINRRGRLDIPVLIQRIQNFPDNQGLVGVGHFAMNSTISASGMASIPAGGNSDVTVDLYIGTDPTEVTLENATGKSIRISTLTLTR